ncbi:2,3,4,5-tetrahydropyridine-2,6-carboxylate N-succinyltransferase [Rhodobacterales bacterium HKCCE2091]|nr:2,3,4,5-tetrahydropyridine-2,6-carboxylate N-succinyltransferase [Rhodobacterales bacterium HKCCE2091]
MATAAELLINTAATSWQMVRTIFGPDVAILSTRYDGDPLSSGIWTLGDLTSPQLTPSDTGVILSTGHVNNVTRLIGDPNISTGTSTNTSGDNNDADFNAAAGRSTYDASYLEATIRPSTNFLSFQFTFASEEYPHTPGSIYNDLFAIWVNGQYVSSPIFGDIEVSDIGPDVTENLYLDNANDDYNTEMDGFSVTMSVLIPVNPNVPNTIKLGIADVGDNQYDSAILIAANSAQGLFLTRDDIAVVFEGQTAEVDALANDDAVGVAFITHVNGTAISTGGSVTLNSGHVVTLTPAGTLSVVPPPDQTGLTAPESINFTYTAQGSGGITDTAFVTITAIPCFAAGTLIRTAGGEVPVELLAPGDLVETRDHGPQPIRWIGRRRVDAAGNFAPVVIEPGTFGHHDRLVLSPQHRVLIRHPMAELMFGEDEVLVAAKDLVNGVSVHVREGGEVAYFHLLFDRHQMIWSDGLLTESFLPGPQTLSAFEQDICEELFALFPDIDRVTGRGYGSSARIGLKSYEARAMFD